MILCGIPFFSFARDCEQSTTSSLSAPVPLSPTLRTRQNKLFSGATLRSSPPVDLKMRTSVAVTLSNFVACHPGALLSGALSGAFGGGGCPLLNHGVDLTLAWCHPRGTITCLTLTFGGQDLQPIPGKEHLVISKGLSVPQAVLGSPHLEAMWVRAAWVVSKHIL